MFQILHGGILILMKLFVVYLKSNVTSCPVFLFGRSGSPSPIWAGEGCGVRRKVNLAYTSCTSPMYKENCSCLRLVGSREGSGGQAILAELSGQGQGGPGTLASSIDSG